MAATTPSTTARATRQEDQRVFLHDVSWSQYELILSVRGDRAVPRMTYLDGELELMTPAVDHEGIKSAIRRLLEAYVLERGLSLNAYGSWTVRSAPRARGVEPDECYVVGARRPDAPDLAIEVIWTSGGIDKLEVHRGLGVGEVWFWREGKIEVYVLREERYVSHPTSELFPELDLLRLQAFVAEPDQSQAVRSFLAWLRDGARG